MTDAAPLRIAAFYCFVPIADPAGARARLLPLCEGADVRGTIILANEGFNGTMAGPEAGIAALVDALVALAGDAVPEIKYAWTDAMPFGRLKIRCKREIVTMGVPDLDLLSGRGDYVEPAEWNALIARDETLIVDTRNVYEVSIGTFQGATDPGTRGFADFPAWLAKLADGLSEEERRDRPLAMFCTGGIRCEKSTALARSLGFGRVYHLKGGILAYLEQVAEEDSRWRGDCFVFDERVSVGHGLAPGNHAMCAHCGRPVPRESMDAHRALCTG